MTAVANVDFVNVRLPMEDERQLYRLSIRDGVWTQIIRQDGAASPPEAVSLDNMKQFQGKAGMFEVIDLEGKMLLPGFVDAHMHLDKAFSLASVGNRSGTLEEAVLNYSQASPAFTKQDIKARIMRSAMQALSFGTTHIRTHLDFNLRVSREVALRTIEAALEAKEALASYVTIQLFPMCPYNFMSLDAEAIEEALRMGVDGIGGAPHLSITPKEDIDYVFKLAEKYDVPVDLHCDETDNPAMRTVLHIAERTKSQGYEGRVTVDHLCALASMTDADAHGIINRMADARLKAVSLPAVNLYLQGRHDSFPVRRGVTRLKEIWEAGIPIAVASDNIHDPFHPFGRGDLLQIALIGSYAAHMGRPDDLRTLLRMITDVPAQVLGLTGTGIQAGHEASFVILDGSTPEEIFTMLPERRWVYSRGRWVRIAAAKAEWQDSQLARYWQEAAEKVSFHQHEFVKG
ncbi:amidohydrolase family protein [Paenibacillus sp. GCM10023248]|uniref:amidohydrolase family protein n=1 Tax=Bacillales TaxID=1385 RepID=UPI0023786E31|nr:MULTISPECIES: amidohydrolase family protein [Bacillales]MDD9269322.1 amidohydrolase family protein [Paenibacillus sp. MAHUQ-63]MDR6880454.1 cytosine deaminase [Bacillus sp. 3255]